MDVTFVQSGADWVPVQLSIERLGRTGTRENDARLFTYCLRVSTLCGCFDHVSECSCPLSDWYERSYRYRICAPVCMSVRVCMYLYSCVCVYVYMCVCVCVCVCVDG